ncbi:MAG: LrgB family protein [Oscillospiraceae bacterium]|nr:LrgB family protein [Oscillospiraceae bacterium]
MREFLMGSSYFGLVLSLAAFEIGLQLRKRSSFFLFNPLLVAIAICIPLLLALNIPPEVYVAAGAGHLSFLLTPCTVCLAVPLYRQVEALKQNLWAILGGICSGVAACMVTVPLLSYLLRLSHEEYVSLLSKSITTTIGIGMTEELGGMVSFTIVAIYFTGMVGGVSATALCRLFRLTEPVAKGIAIGTSSHAMGTAYALQMGETEGAMSGLSIGITGILTAIVAPLAAGLL